LESAKCCGQQGLDVSVSPQAAPLSPEDPDHEGVSNVAEVESRASAPTNQQDLYRAACAAMRLLQDRQAPTPQASPHTTGDA